MKCPKCHTSYRTDNRRSPNRRAPVLLSCGHGCCETCAQSALLYICSLCNEKTRVIRGQLPKHLYIFGLVAESYSLPINLDGHLEMRLDPIRMLAVKEHMKGLCQECSENKATFRCRKCMSELCDPCFKKIHAHKTMKKHIPEPFHTVQSAYLRPPCPSHPDVISSHMCYTCSSEDVGQNMFCTTCFMFGPHCQHDVVEFDKLAEQYMTEVKVGVEELTGAIDQLEESRLTHSSPDSLHLPVEQVMLCAGVASGSRGAAGEVNGEVPRVAQHRVRRLVLRHALDAGPVVLGLRGKDQGARGHVAVHARLREEEKGELERGRE
ncbi:RING finger protein 17 [Penaeus vannamei]|uniref:RING finger protein 17 n=1 Tax=Penaeus vannamei TaxID=6689 RepID=A0A3R7MIB4_PENVA|nr:RING finger protein 17 [Penaeus vannamei]